MGSDILPHTAEDLIRLQARQATELHELALRERHRAAELQDIALEKARTELTMLKEKGPVAATTDTEQSPGELTPETLSLLILHPNVSPRLVTTIVKNTFDPYDLYKLRPGIFQYEAEKDQGLTITEGQVRVRRTTGQLKDYGDSQMVWALAFNIYHSLVNAIHGHAHPKLMHGMLQFTRQILELAEVYHWQRQVLSLALEHHCIVIGTGVANAESWPIPAMTHDRWCNNLLAPSSGPLSKKRSSEGIRTAKQPAAETTVCNNWNATGCSYGPCIRKHVCSKCGDSLHTALKCKK
jgi:hypothetical protein